MSSLPAYVFKVAKKIFPFSWNILYIKSILQFVTKTTEKTKSKKVARNPSCFKLSASFSLRSIKNFDTSVSFSEKEIKMNFLLKGKGKSEEQSKEKNLMRVL